MLNNISDFWLKSALRDGANTVFAKYARHAQQTSADVRQGAQTIPDIFSSRVQYTENGEEMPDIKHNICWSFIITRDHSTQPIG